MKEIDQFLSDVSEMPIWGAKKGVGSFITFELGKSDEEGFGEYHVWIYCCDWVFRSSKAVLAHSESSDEEIRSAASKLNAEFLKAISLNKGASTFEFCDDLAIETTPYSDGDEDQWLIYLPDGNVITYFRNGNTTLESASKTPEQ